MTTETSNARREWQPLRYFAYDGDNGDYSEFDTLNEAVASAEESLSYAGDDGWPDGGPSICYGAVLGEAREVEGSRRKSDNPDFDFIVEYKLTDAAAPPPAAARGDVRGLVGRWRDKDSLPPLPEAAYAQARVCAAELEYALAAEGVQAGAVSAEAEVDALRVLLHEAWGHVPSGRLADRIHVALTRDVAIASAIATDGVQAGEVCIATHWLENIAAAAALLEASGDVFNVREAAALRKLIASAKDTAPPSAPVGVDDDVVIDALETALRYVQFTANGKQTLLEEKLQSALATQHQEPTT